MTTWFSYPLALWLLALLPVVLGVEWWLQWRRGKALEQFGNPTLLTPLLRYLPWRRRLRTACFLGGLVLLLLTCAGPQWGREPQPQTATGRDLVVVLDLSRSMLAEQPSRLERARRALRDLADELERGGGHRVALVIFAAAPHLVFPLTADYDHFRTALNALDSDLLRPRLRPKAAEIKSGTRIGAALSLAVQTIDPHAQGAQDILLLSDGDDPADDDEWAQGAADARRQSIPVHTIGVGDPHQASPIPSGDGFLRFAQEPVQTRLQEQPLQEIASRTEGIYLPAHTLALPLGRWFREVLEPRGRRLETAPADIAGLTLRRQRAPWFLAGSLALLACSLLIADGLPSRTRNPGRRTSAEKVPVPFFLLLIAAAPLSSVLDLLRQGNTAFAKEKYEAALHNYEQAEEGASDPGLVAFNKGAALYRLGRYREAELHYRRCLADQQIPPARHSRAWYDLGNCLFWQGQPHDVQLLDEACACYRRALELEPKDPRLRDDAAHNLELARMFWIKVKTQAQHKPPGEGPGQEPKQPQKGDSQAQKNGTSSKGTPTKENGSPSEQKGSKGISDPDQEKALSPGPLQVLPDTAELKPLAPEDVAAFLEQAAARISRERRAHFRRAAPAVEGVKDW